MNRDKTERKSADGTFRFSSGAILINRHLRVCDFQSMICQKWSPKLWKNNNKINLYKHQKAANFKGEVGLYNFNI